MAYVPNPVDVTQPVESVFAKTAAAEFRALKAYIQTIVSGGGPGAQTPGMIADFPYASAPPGWLELDGSLQSRTGLANLWALAVSLGPVVAEAVWASGNNYGSFSDGDGATTFRIPDFRSMLRKARDNGRGFGGTVQGKFTPPTANHYHSMPFGWDASSYYAWRDGSDNPVYGSDVQSGTAKFGFATSGAATGSTIRVARTAGVGGTAGDWIIPANNGVITCIKT
jgi:hypothetical protein